MKCPNCGSTEIETNHARGDTVCGKCGNVFEENIVVSEITFENTKFHGQIVSDSSKLYKIT